MAITILNDAHFSAIACFAIDGNWSEVASLTEAQRLADSLKSLNVLAFNDVNMDEPGVPESSCVLSCEQPVPTPVQVLKLIEQYEFHASRYGGYFHEQAAYDLRAIRSAALAQLDGYAEAPYTH